MFDYSRTIGPQAGGLRALLAGLALAGALTACGSEQEAGPRPALDPAVEVEQVEVEGVEATRDPAPAPTALRPGLDYLP